MMEYKPGPVFTSLIEMKLDQATALEWQRLTQGTSKVPHHSELLKFLDFRTQALESTTCEGQIGSIKCPAQSMPHKANVLQKLCFLPTQLILALCAMGQSTLYMRAENLDHCHTTSVMCQ